MKYSPLSLTTLLLLQGISSSLAFTIPTANTSNRVSRTTRFASTLENTSTSTKLELANETKKEFNNGNNNNNNNNNKKDNEDEQDADSRIRAVSANHIVMWDDEKNELVIKECTIESGAGGANNNDGGRLKYRIEYEETIYMREGDNNINLNTNTIGHDDHDKEFFSSPSSSLSSSSSPTSTVVTTTATNNVNGIKMTNSNDAKLLQKDTTMEASDSKKSSKSNSSNNDNRSTSTTSFTERITNSGVASAAAMATAAVNAAVSMKTLEAPSTAKSYISIDKSQTIIDEDGLPLQYDKDAIENYWKKERGALNKRWGYFVSKAVPFLTRLTTLFIKDGKIDDKYIPELSEQARIDLQDLGPTFIKAGQMMSVRPDVLPQVSFRKSFVSCHKI